ncbi:RluA family pseudouridine synthase [Butyrivibrio sp. CB08]|uniref:RluA family pseudouridine synthase n=1 Tax=Butyrivibrio sp. CB08 TaxID=2364879 RepID=UPI000EAA4C9F|nr:RluA family pseudouridine synthase [Butyrivibrio sp. CB08]RKM58875.1 RluA family pseudouridine synthase [Butyrivibrio sp. CB08]
MLGSIRVIYEDQDILVCHKAAGMATEGARAGRLDLISAARNYLARKNREVDKGRQRNLPPYVATINRLDQAVEGVIVLAKNKKAASDLADQIKKRNATKYYYALCQGLFPEKEGEVTGFVIRREDTGLAQVISEGVKDSFDEGAVTLENGEKVRLIGGDVKEAKLEYQVVAENDGVSLLRVHLLTGRFHQIRVQLASLGHPILGDDKYGTADSKALSEEMGIKNVCLAAYKYGIKHPGTKKYVEYEITPDNPAIKDMLPM